MEHLKSNSYITNIEPMVLTEEVLSQYIPGVQKHVKEENSRINVYRMTYKSQGHKVNGYILEPKEGENLPCIIMNRGGTKEFGIWTEGDVFNRMGRLASLGYVVIASQLSGCAGSEGNDEVGGSDLEDILVLRDLLAEHPRADSDKIGMFGASRGGLMIYLALAKVTWIKAAVSRAAVSNKFKAYEERPGVKEFHSQCYDVNDPEELRKRSAIFWPEKFCKTTPLLIIHGTADKRVSALHSIELAAKLYEHKVPFRLNLFEGADHNINEFKTQEWRATELWFERFLKNDEPLPNLEPHGD